MTETMVREDRRFAIQRVSQPTWQRATAVNLAADHLAGYDLWTSAYVDTHAEWDTLAQYLRESSKTEISEYVEQHRRESLAFLVMMLTGACNADCAICFTDRRRKRAESTPELRDRVIREAAECGASFVYVPGEGEPTIDRGWWEFLDSCRNGGLHAVVFTNGLIFSHAATSRKYWGCEPDETMARLADYPVSFYVKMWSTQPELVGDMLGIDPAKYDFVDYAGVRVPSGMVRALERLPRERLGIEVVVERRNADEVVDTVVPFADDHGLAQIVEMIQHNGRTLGDPSYDPSPTQVARVRPYLSPTSCKLATCKAVVTSQGYLSPRIAILEHQLPQGRVHVGSGSLWELLHNTDYIVQRRYETACLCESEPMSRAQSTGSVVTRAGNVVAPALRQASDTSDTSVTSVEPVAGEPRVVVNDFPADTTVAQLVTGEVGHNARVRVVGRAVPRATHQPVPALADGPSVVALRCDLVPDYAWVGVTGRWDSISETLHADADGVALIGLANRAPTIGAHPESVVVREPGRLTAIVQRGALTSLLRKLFDEAGYLEVATPFLQVAGEMCRISQAVTEPIAGRRFFLRTDPEEYLKRYLSAGLDSVYEVAMNVRADPPDDQHLVEFGLIEFYRRLQPFDDLVSWTDEVIRRALAEIGGREIPWSGTRIDTRRPFTRVGFADLVTSVTGVEVDAPECATAEGLAAALRKGGVPVQVDGELRHWRRSFLEGLLDQYVLPGLTRPVWVTHFPADLALSSRLDPKDPGRSLRAELYLPGGLELAHVYEVLVDGEELRNRYDSRRSHRVAAGMAHVPTNEGLMTSADIGIPPMSGGGIGIDRLLMVARNDRRIGAGLLFAGEGYHQLRDAVGGCASGSCGVGGCGDLCSSAREHASSTAGEHASSAGGCGDACGCGGHGHRL